MILLKEREKGKRLDICSISHAYIHTPSPNSFTKERRKERGKVICKEEPPVTASTQAGKLHPINALPQSREAKRESLENTDKGRVLI